jgi:hypothetical protein
VGIKFIIEKLVRQIYARFVALSCQAEDAKKYNEHEGNPKKKESRSTISTTI